MVEKIRKKCDVDKLLQLLSLVENKEMKSKDAAFYCGYTSEHFCRLRKKYKKMGIEEFKKIFSAPKRNHTKSKFDKKFIIDKYSLSYNNKRPFLDFKYYLFEEYNLKISYPMLTKILNNAGIETPYKYRVKHQEKHSPRPPKNHEGELVQVDATPIRILSCFKDSKQYALHGIVDDATKKIIALYFCENECSYGYFEVFRQCALKYGIPLSDYTDKLKLFNRSNAKLTEEEELQGLKRHKTDWERLCEGLHIKHILAHSPQAKGRVERMWNTVIKQLQGYVEEHNLNTIEKINEYLPKYIERYNNRYQRTPKFEKKVWQKPPEDLDYWLCRKESRKCSTHNIVRFMNLNLKPTQKKLAGKIIDVCINKDGLFTYSHEEKKFYELKILDDANNIDLSLNTPQVLENIIYDYLYKSEKHDEKTDAA